MTPVKRFTVLLCIPIWLLAACGGSDESASVTSTSAAPGEVATTVASPTSSEPATGATSTQATTTTTASTTTGDSAGEGQVQVVFDDGRSWTFDGTCIYTPDNTQPASALWNIDAVAADGTSIIAIMAFPFDPANTTPVLIGNIVDADGNLFILIESEDVSDGSNLILNWGIHDGIKTVDDPIDITATATCGL